MTYLNLNIFSESYILLLLNINFLIAASLWKQQGKQSKLSFLWIIEKQELKFS